MEQISTIGLDIAKNVFQVHGVDEGGNVVVERRLRRAGVLDFFRRQQPVGMIREPFFGYHQGQRQNAALTGRTHDRTQTGKKHHNFLLAKTEPSTHD